MFADETRAVENVAVAVYECLALVPIGPGLAQCVTNCLNKPMLGVLSEMMSAFCSVGARLL